MLAALSLVASSSRVAAVPSTRLSRNRCHLRPVTYKRNLKAAVAAYYCENWQLKLSVRSKETTKPNSQWGIKCCWRWVAKHFFGR